MTQKELDYINEKFDKLIELMRHGKNITAWNIEQFREKLVSGLKQMEKNPNQ